MARQVVALALLFVALVAGLAHAADSPASSPAADSISMTPSASPDASDVEPSSPPAPASAPNAAAPTLSISAAPETDAPIADSPVAGGPSGLVKSSLLPLPPKIGLVNLFLIQSILKAHKNIARMKREGRQHGLVRTYPIIPSAWNPRPNSMYCSQLEKAKM
ncbi:hypothetical protein RND71_034073 [Anisodus tanguticus]|uniref:Uncharacterized protein n=1 Tax=Anisodus tanguticus TaxID=243964 RepID=A0AAE1RAL0_9SOLA|nr:hypothetical protein RND71_034073 [Anisodus tanguticus]